MMAAPEILTLVTDESLFLYQRHSTSKTTLNVLCTTQSLEANFKTSFCSTVFKNGKTLNDIWCTKTHKTNRLPASI